MVRVRNGHHRPTRRVAAIIAGLALVVGGAQFASADQLIEGGPVTPDPGTVSIVPGDPCIAENEYESHVYGEAERYVDLGCKRIEFSLGPILVKPGQNEALIMPTTVESPRYDGYIVRFKPDLQVAVDGRKTQTDVMHLHHATWLNLGASYGDGPFFAAGEEKTIATFPQGYGMKVKATDEWGLLYMVHNATTEVEEVWITYTIDFVPAAPAEEIDPATGLARVLPIKPLWFDVQKSPVHPDAGNSSSNPVFHTQRGFGTTDAETGRLACRWPDQNCSRFDQYGRVSPQMGRDIDAEAGFAPAPGFRSSAPGLGQITGTKWRVPANLAGTVIGLGGHLHPGGLRVELDQSRSGRTENIFVSDAVYWDFDDPTRAGGPPASWNLSMTLTGLPLGWGVDIAAGDVLSINAIYDTADASWYEGMGIIVAVVAETLQPWDRSVDVFNDDVTISRGIPTTAITPPGPFYAATGFRPESCTPNLDAAAGPLVLCARGQITHGAVEESSNRGGCPSGVCQALPDKAGPIVTDITSQAFTYGVADMGVIGQSGIPRIVQGEEARFWSYDSAARIWHTYTACAAPCTGPTGVAYPIADANAGVDPGSMDFDSGELGYGILTEPSKSQIGGSKPYDRKWLEDGLVWRFTPEETGTFTFWCRIHPSMRGAFEVITSDEAASETTVSGNGGNF